MFGIYLTHELYLQIIMQKINSVNSHSVTVICLTCLIYIVYMEELMTSGGSLKIVSYY